MADDFGKARDAMVEGKREAKRQERLRDRNVKMQGGPDERTFGAFVFPLFL
jgi:hypothetical protein